LKLNGVGIEKGSKNCTCIDLKSGQYFKIKTAIMKKNLLLMLVVLSFTITSGRLSAQFTDLITIIPVVVVKHQGNGMM